MSDMPIDRWLDQLAAKQPTPGGGGAAALSAAVAAGLIGMVSVYTTGDKWGEVSQRMQAISDEAADLRGQALALMQADATAFQAVGAAYALPKQTDVEKLQRMAAIQAALTRAAQPPTDVAKVAQQLMTLVAELAPTGNPNVISDVAVAASNARAALEGAIINIEVNARLLTDENLKQALSEAVVAAEQAIQQADEVIASVRERLGA